eukprot:4896633-Amphidinium_carterae.1
MNKTQKKCSEKRNVIISVRIVLRVRNWDMIWRTIVLRGSKCNFANLSQHLQTHDVVVVWRWTDCCRLKSLVGGMEFGGSAWAPARTAQSPF